MSEEIPTKPFKTAVVFGISGNQGQYSAKGLLASQSYTKVYGVTRVASADHIDTIARHTGAEVVLEHIHEDNKCTNTGPVSAGQLVLLEGDPSNQSSLRSILEYTRGTHIFLVTTMDFPPIDSAVVGFHDEEEREYETIRNFFDAVLTFHEEGWNRRDCQVGTDVLERHVIFSTSENVRGLVEWLEARRGESPVDADDFLTVEPLDDGGIVPHFTGKGRGGEYALSLIHGVPSPWKTNDLEKTLYSTKSTPSIIPGLSVTLITLPFLHSNFVAGAAPLPIATSSKRQCTQWAISACLGDPSHCLDMLSVSDLQYIIPSLFQNHHKYQGRNIRLSSEKISMDEGAYKFSDLFGKDVVYSPLTVAEMSMLDIPGALAFAQMCQYWASSYASRGNLAETKAILRGCRERDPTTFHEWLLTHSDNVAFEKVGLTRDASPINCVAVFNATCLQGKSVIKGLLADTRKECKVRACILCCNDTEDDLRDVAVQNLTSLDPERITVHYVNIGDVESCTMALEGVDGVFIVMDLYQRHFPQQPLIDSEREEREELITRNMIDACDAVGTVRHIVLSTLESVKDVDTELKEADGCVVLDGDNNDMAGNKIFDVKTRLASYARTKHISVTYVLMPVYSESFFFAIAEKIRNNEISVDEREHDVFDDEGEKVLCMSVDELGPAVANIFDSYEVFAGHEIALMTDTLSLQEAYSIIKRVFFESKSATVSIPGGNTETSVTVVDTSSWSTALTGGPHLEFELDTFPKDLGQMFRFLNRTNAVKHRQTVARTMELVPDSKPFYEWLEANRDNVEFREMLGIR